MGDQYTATACFPDGRTITSTGSLQQVSNWADNIIRANGCCEIFIEREPEKSA